MSTDKGGKYNFHRIVPTKSVVLPLMLYERKIKQIITDISSGAIINLDWSQRLLETIFDRTYQVHRKTSDNSLEEWTHLQGRQLDKTIFIFLVNQGFLSNERICFCFVFHSAIIENTSVSL